LEVKPNAVHNALLRIRRKMGLELGDDLAEWAKAHALDAALEPESPLPKALPKKRGRKRILMGRIRRANRRTP